MRQHSPWPPKEAQQVEENAAVEKKSEEDLRGESETTEVPDLAADIQAIMTVIRRRTRSFLDGEPERLDLHETNLFRANLFRANLSGADLSGADLRGAYLVEAILTQEQLEETKFGDTDTRLPPHLKPPAHWNVKTDEQIEGD